MSWNNISRRPADIDYSNYIREKAFWTCEYCRKVCKIGDNRFYQLEASHYFSRGHESVRFDDRNVHALCSACHKRMNGYTNKEDGEYDLWIKKLLGEKGYKILKLNAYQKGERNDKLTRMVIKQLMSDLKTKRNNGPQGVC